MRSDAEKLVIYKPWREARDRSFTANFDFRLLASPAVGQYISVTKSTISVWSFVTASQLPNTVAQPNSRVHRAQRKCSPGSTLTSYVTLVSHSKTP